MNRIIKYMMTCTALSLLITFGGCDEQEAALYSDEPKISFTRGDNGYGQQDSVTQSFFLLPSDQLRDTVWVELSLEGTSSTIPRTIKIEQTNVGKVGAAEVDFIAAGYEGEEYYQVAYTVIDADGSTLERELKPLNAINDHNPKYLLTMDYGPLISHNGIRQLYVLDWLLK